MCFGCSKEPSHRDGSFEYPQHMFWLRNKKNNFQLCTLIWGPDLETDFLTTWLKNGAMTEESKAPDKAMAKYKCVTKLTG